MNEFQGMLLYRGGWKGVPAHNKYMAVWGMSHRIAWAAGWKKFNAVQTPRYVKRQPKLWIDNKGGRHFTRRQLNFGQPTNGRRIHLLPWQGYK